MKNLFLLWCFLLTQSSFVCECITGKSFEEHVESVDVIFYGTVKTINDSTYEGFKHMMDFIFDPENYPENYGYKPTFEIIELYKGEFKTPLVENLYEYKSNWCNCDRAFKKGYSYIVFGHTREDGEINTSICVPGGIIYDPEYFDRLNSALSPGENKR